MNLHRWPCLAVPRSALFGALLLAGASLALGQSSEREARELLKSYVAAHNDHDLEAVMALYDRDAVFHLSMGRPPVHGRDAIRELERFDVAAGSTIYPQRVTVEADGDRWRIHIGGAIEHSRVFAAAGVTIVMAQPIRDAFVLRAGRIVEIHQPELEPACSETVLAAFRGAVAWLATRGDERLDSLVDEGRIRLTPETLPGVVDLLAAWRDAGNRASDGATVGRCARFDP